MERLFDSRDFLLRQLRWTELTVGLVVVLVSRELADFPFPLLPVLILFAGAFGLQACLVLLTRSSAASLPVLPILAADAATWLPLLALTGGAVSPYPFFLLFPAAHVGLLAATLRAGLCATGALLGLFAATVAVRWPGEIAAPPDGGLVLGITLLLGVLLSSVTYLVRTARSTLPPGWVALPEPVENLAQRAAGETGLILGENGDLPDLLEEAVLALTRIPGVVFAAAVTAPGWPASARLGGEAAGPKRCIVSGEGHLWPQWFDLPREAAVFFDLVEHDPEQPFVAGAADALRKIHFPLTAGAQFDRWLMAPFGHRDEAGLVVLVGMRSREADPAYVRLTLAHLDSQIAPLLAASGNLARLRGELDSLHAENETLARINKMQSDFVAVASHELKTPLTAITAYVEALQRNWGRPDFRQAEDFMGIIREEAGRLLRMVNRILDFSRLEFGQRLLNRRVMDIEPLLRDTLRAIEPLAVQKRQRLSIECPPLLPRVEIDEDLIRQVMVNLVNNAVKYTPDGGSITVRVSEDAATVRVEVQDNGAGIAAEELHRIFRQFYRAGGASETVEGFGLGLSIVKNIIDLHGGHIDVQSEVGRGSTFVVHLPKEHHLNPVTAAILGDLTTRPQFQQLLRLTVRMVAEMTESKIVSLMLLDREGRSLVVQSAYGLNEAIVKSAHVTIGKGIAGKVLQSGRPLLVKDVEKDGLLATNNRGQYETNSLVSVPLKIEDRVVGVINVNNKVSGLPFAEDDLVLVTTLADKVSAALAEAMKVDSSQRRVEKIVDALQALIVMKRKAVPTATPLALRLIVQTARRLGLSPSEIQRLQYVASMHDVGMVTVDGEILAKCGPLTEDERDEVGQHPEQGVTLMQPLLQAPDMDSIIMAHHERPDGRGYPLGLRGGDIPVGARILAVVDAFFAMVQRRPWRARSSVPDAVAELRANAGCQFDSPVVTAFVAILQQEGLLTSDRPAEAQPAGAPAGGGGEG